MRAAFKLGSGAASRSRGASQDSGLRYRVEGQPTPIALDSLELWRGTPAISSAITPGPHEDIGEVGDIRTRAVALPRERRRLDAGTGGAGALGRSGSGGRALVAGGARSAVDPQLRRCAGARSGAQRRGALRSRTGRGAKRGERSRHLAHPRVRTAPRHARRLRRPRRTPPTRAPFARHLALGTLCSTGERATHAPMPTLLARDELGQALSQSAALVA
jgi:hypothetical protein